MATLLTIISVLALVLFASGEDKIEAQQEQGHVVLQIFETSVTATVASAPFGLFDFKVVIVGRERDLKCDIKGGSDPLACTIKNLTPATTYNLKVFNCRQGSSFCSDTLYNGWFTTVADVPMKVAIDEITETRGRVSVFIPMDASDLYDYKAQVIGHEKDLNCKMKVESSQRSCNLTKLVPGTTYPVKVLSCLKGTTNCKEIFTGLFTTAAIKKPIVIVDGITESAAKVHVIPAAGTEKDFIYKAQITGLESTHSCKITHDTPHWECFLTKLTPATHYNLKVFRCAIDSSNCEKVLDGSFKSAMEEKKKIVLESIMSQQVTVQLNPPPGSTIVPPYIAYAKGGNFIPSCEMSVGTDKLRCTVTELSSYTRYMLQVRRCDVSPCRLYGEVMFTTADASLRTKVSIGQISENGTTVTLRPPPDAIGLYDFRAQINGRPFEHKCEAIANGTTQICHIEHLVGDTTYRVRIFSCRKGISGCRSIFEGWFTTLVPPKKLIALKPITSTTVTVVLTPMPGTLIIPPYKALIKGNAPHPHCSFLVGREELKCSITGLKPNTTYTLEVRRCDVAPCQHVGEEKFTTASAPSKAPVFQKVIQPPTVTVTVKPIYKTLEYLIEEEETAMESGAF